MPESQKVPKVFELMRSKKVHMALIVDEYGTLAGAVTMEDLLEEIVGEIEDETDTTTVGKIRKISDNEWKTDGLISLGDLQKTVGLNVSADLDANSLSGLFMERLARMPEAGDELIEDQFRLTVLSVKNRRVGMVSVESLADDNESDQSDSGHISET